MALKDTLQAYNAKVIEKLNYLHSQLGNVSPWKGLSPETDNALTEDAEGKLYYRKQTPEEIAAAYEGIPTIERFTSTHKQTLEEFTGDLYNKADLDPDTNKLRIDQVPQFSITNAIKASETTLTDFVTNVNNYQFDEGDVIVINNSGSLEHYLYDGGDRSLEVSYSPVSAPSLSSIDWGNVTNKPNVELKSNKGAADGYAPLGSDSKVPAIYLPEQSGGSATVEDAIVDGVTDKAPSQNAVLDALEGKANDSEVVKSVNGNLPDENGDVTVEGGDSTLPIEKTGNTIVFTERANYNYETPATGNIIIDPTGAVKDIVVAFFFQGETPPEITGADCIMRSGRFVSNKKLIYWFLWFDGGYSLNIQADNRTIEQPTEPTDPQPTGNILLEDDFSGTTIDTSKWTVTQGAQTEISQNDGLNFTDVATSSSMSLSDVKSIDTFDSTFQTLVLRFDALISDPTANINFLSGLFTDPDKVWLGGGKETENYRSIWRDGTETLNDASGIIPYNQSYKVKIESGSAYFYYWSGSEWILMTEDVCDNNLYQICFRRNASSVSGVAAKIAFMKLSDFDYTTLNP